MQLGAIPAPGRRGFSARLGAVAAALVLAGGAAASTPPPYATVAHTEQLILASAFAANNAITDVSCVGLTHPKPKTNSAGQKTFHRFRCVISGSYFTDTTVIVVLTGNGGFEVLPVTP
jgi:hypothetical protein